MGPTSDRLDCRRERGEQTALWERVQSAVTTPTRREEVLHMIRSYAEELLDEGRAEGRAEGEQEAARRLILTTVYERFGVSTPELEAAVRSLEDVTELEQLLRRVVRAERLEDVDLGEH
jgi:hypothetical protein